MEIFVVCLGIVCIEVMIVKLQRMLCSRVLDHEVQVVISITSLLLGALH